MQLNKRGMPATFIHKNWITSLKGKTEKLIVKEFGECLKTFPPHSLTPRLVTIR